MSEPIGTRPTDREVTDADGRWIERTRANGTVSRVLVEPAPEFEARRTADREAQQTRREQEADAVRAYIAGLEAATTIAQLRAAFVAREKERLGWTPSERG